jgi:ATP-dependent DNA helicase RecG
MPAGRKKVITDIVMPDRREKMYEFIKSEMAAGRQLYVICPRIDEPDPDKEFALQAKSVKAEAERLKRNVFRDKTIDILHSKMTTSEKEKVMQDFSDGKIDILCATSVVEVGVNVPNATLIIIEGAERFGLAQLHQLRGRVIRSNHQAYCFVMPNSESKKSVDRLKALKTAKNGFELSELDLKLRGSGDLAGMKQWGVTDLGMEAIKNMKMVEAARKEAQEIITKNLLPKLPALEAEFLKREKKIHFE